MTDENLPAHLAQIDNRTLTPLVQCALNQPTAAILTWRCETIHAGLGLEQSSIALRGNARARGKRCPGR